MTTINQADACCSSCTATNSPAVAIACTLDSNSLKDRVGTFRDLASRYLLSSRREPLKLHLRYAAAALPEVQALVVQEEECCAFLGFEIRVGGSVELNITAPESAALAVDELFANFAPELARTAA